ncbi:MAG TPA: hypothetical protein VLF61_02725 [Rhabdochlamydiaceae bacterium]|nr:hypothetical protein [Rhabdochlamydiaceae bacterium]
MVKKVGPKANAQQQQAQAKQNLGKAQAATIEKVKEANPTGKVEQAKKVSMPQVEATAPKSAKATDKKAAKAFQMNKSSFKRR